MNYSARAALDFAGASTYNIYRYRSIAGVAELADARDLKSLDSDVVPVQARSPAPVKIPAMRRVFLLVQRIPIRGGLRPLELPLADLSLDQVRYEYSYRKKIPVLSAGIFAGVKDSDSRLNEIEKKMSIIPRQSCTIMNNY